MKTLLLHIPDTLELAKACGRKQPFCLWQVVEKPLLHHWFDFAVDNAFLSVKIKCSQAELSKLQKCVDETTLWPIEVTLEQSLRDDKEPAFMVNKLPHSDYQPGALRNGNDILVQHAHLVKQRLDYIWKTIAKEHPYYLIGHNSYVHPDSLLSGPYWLGEDVVIEENVYIGPYTCIGNHSRIAKGVSLQESTIAGNLVINENLNFQSHLVEECQIFNHKRRILHPTVPRDVVGVRAAA